MATRETRLASGRRRGRALKSRLLRELRDARLIAGISQRTLARELQITQGQVWRIEADAIDDFGVVRLFEIAAILGMEPSVVLHPMGDPIRDSGQQPLGRRFDAMLSSAWHTTNEALLPRPGDRRAWDKLLNLTTYPRRYLVGVDLESRVRDIQDLTRRTRLRERDGGVDALLVVLSDSATNRRLRQPLIDSLGEAYRTSVAGIRVALRDGVPLPGSGVVLV